MDIPGYDAWKLSGPPEDDGPHCDYCGDGVDIRIAHDGAKICEECCDTAEGTNFENLQTAEDYARDQADAKADYLYEQRRDRDAE